MRLLVLALPLVLAFAPDELDTRIDAFAGKISPGGDETVVRFQKAAGTRPGKIVLRDRVEKAADALRSRSERDAVPEYFRTYFEEAGGVYRLRKGQDEVRRRILDEFIACKADMDRIGPLVKEVADNLADSPEINAKLKAYLSHPGIVENLYLGDLRQKARPDIYVILKKLGDLFAQAEDGRFYIPEARHETADRFVRVGRAVLDATATASGRLKSVCDDLVALDNTHERLKAAAPDPLFSMVFLKKALDNADLNDIEPAIQKLKEMTDELNRKLPEAFETTPKGKVLTEKASDGIAKALDKYDQARSKVGMLRAPGKQLASRLRDSDERSETFRRMFQSDALLALLDVDVNGNEADPAKYVAAKIKQAVSKDADGKYRVLPEVSDDLNRELKDPVRTAEKQDRAFKVVSMHGEKIEDKELREVFTSRYGKFEVERTMKERLSVRSYDGLQSWIGLHFDAAGGSYTLRAASRGEIEAILKEIERLESESKKNDLKD
ncbi:MAG TPA: hypothetical protein VNM14_17920 [Planctomycetota bacterium]|nr:hypothetical protein [Planctomycetota bacterium]